MHVVLRPRHGQRRRQLEPLSVRLVTVHFHFGTLYALYCGWLNFFLFVAQPFDDAGASEFSFSTMETDSHSKKLDEISQTLALLTKTVKEIQASQKTVEMALQTPEEKLEEKPSLQTLEEKRQQSQEMLADKMVGLDLQREIGMLVSPLYSLQPVPESQANGDNKSILIHILKQIMLLLGNVIVVSKSKTLSVLSVATTLVSILIVMLNTLRLVLNAWRKAV